MSAICRVNLCAIVLAGLFNATSALAQDPPPQPERAPARLPPVRVTVTRDAPRAVLDLPFAVSTAAPDSSRPGQRDLALDEVLAFIPGVLVANRSNPTQDPRISIRGFGSRSSFGVRGVRVLRDGIPLTLPDGQTPVDYLDLESVGSIEVIRGSASALYGNAAGGVIDVRSAEPPTTRLSGLVRGLAGSAGLKRWVASGGGTLQRLRYQANASRTETDGFRRHARQEATSGFARLMTRLAGTNLSLQLSAFDMPLAENPGALTSSQAAADPEMADPNFVRRRARKEVEQGQIGLVASRTRAGVG
ncbi:MAG: TonB-dependent receptor plug domain-containing protein, partial [Gemmatimonadaceae bacterium]